MARVIDWDAEDPYADLTDDELRAEIQAVLDTVKQEAMEKLEGLRLDLPNAELVAAADQDRGIEG